MRSFLGIILKKIKLVKLRGKKISDKEKNNTIKLLRKIGYKIKNKTNSIKAFQRRFRQEQIDGIADKECVEIIKNIAPYFV